MKDAKEFVAYWLVWVVFYSVGVKAVFGIQFLMNVIQDIRSNQSVTSRRKLFEDVGGKQPFQSRALGTPRGHAISMALLC